jgi:hypothetical protein
VITPTFGFCEELSLGSLGTLRPVVGDSPASRYHAAALAYFDRVALAGGTLADSTKSLVNTWFNASESYRSKILRANFFLTDTITGLLVATVVNGSVGGSSDTNHGFIGADYSLAVGLTGDGVGKYLDTGVDPNAAASAATLGLFTYLTGASSFADDACLIGTYNGNADRADLSLQNAAAPSDLLGAYITGALGGGRYTPISDTLSSFVGASGSGVGVTTLYVDGTPATVAVPAPTVWSGADMGSLFVFAFNLLANPARYAAAKLGAYVITAGMNDAEVLSMYTDMHALQQGLGRVA